MALSNKPVFTDKRTKDKIDLHLRDINDKITKEDIENVQTDVTLNYQPDILEDKEAAHEADEILKKKQLEEKEKEKEDGNNSNSIETPWNMLD